MAAINDLIAKIADADLRRRIEAEVRRLQHSKKFGLVFEEHLPENILLSHVGIAVGAKVVRRRGDAERIFRVRAIEGDAARCFHPETGEEEM